MIANKRVPIPRAVDFRGLIKFRGNALQPGQVDDNAPADAPKAHQNQEGITQCLFISQEGPSMWNNFLTGN